MVKTLKRAVEWYCTLTSKAYEPIQGKDSTLKEYCRYLAETHK